MSNLTLTLLLAFGLILLALIGVGIGWLITGKSRVRHCGLRAGDQAGGQCGKNVSCPVCGKEEKSVNEDDPSLEDTNR